MARFTNQAQLKYGNAVTNSNIAVGEILDAFFEEYEMGEKAAEPAVLKNQFTRGHFKRGVE